MSREAYWIMEGCPMPGCGGSLYEGEDRGWATCHLCAREFLVRDLVRGQLTETIAPAKTAGRPIGPRSHGRTA